jgi:hypothetical protein
MKVAVFSSFPADILSKEIKPKLGKYAVEVVRVFNVDQWARSSTQFQDLEDAEALVAMVEKMSATQRDKIKTAAKNAGLRFIPLTRKSSDWMRFFEVPEQLVPSRMEARSPGALAAISTRSLGALIDDVAPPSRPTPPPPPPSKPDPRIAAFEHMLGLAKDANESLTSQLAGAKQRAACAEDEVRALRFDIDQVKMERDQLVAEVRRVKAAHDAIEVQGKGIIDALATDAMKSMQQATQERDALRKGHEALSQELSASKDVVQKQAQELFSLRQENLKLRTNLGQRIDAPMPAAAKEFLRVREAFTVLWQSKAFKADDVLKQLLSWEPEGMI